MSISPIPGRTTAPIPAATLLGYSAEGAATNLCLQSQSFDTTWTATALTTISSTRTAPDGTATAFEFDDGVSGGTSHRRFQSPVNTTAVPHTMSVYAKDVDRGWIGFRLTDSGGVNRLCWFNIAAGVVGTAAAGFTTSIQSLPNGWYRCIATLTTFAGDSTPLLFLAPSDGVDVYVGSNKKAQLWGAQLELGSFASSYIATTTTAQTRNRDQLAYSAAGNLDETEDYWVYAEHTPMYQDTGEAFAVSTWNYNDGVGNAGMMLRGSVGGVGDFFTGGNGAITGATTANTAANGVFRKIVGTASGAVAKVCMNGGSVATGVNSKPALPATTMYIGANAAITGFGTIRNVRIGQRQLSASELQAITA